MTNILEFPYDRINREVESHQAKILRLPVRSVDPMLWMGFALFWFTALLPPLR
jgi:hypothetical protein